MAKLLYINANPKSVEHSYSLQVGEHFLKAYRQLNPADTIERIDLYRDEIPVVDDLVLGAWSKAANGQALSEQEQKVLGRMGEILQQFKSADKYVIVLPLFNLGIPSKLKDYIDNVVIARETFKYNENGQPVGLLNDGRSVVVIQGSGGIYSQAPGSDIEFSHMYLQFIMSFIGITNYRIVRAEGTAFLDKEEVLNKAKQEAEEAAAALAKSAQTV